MTDITRWLSVQMNACLLIQKANCLCGLGKPANRDKYLVL